jgi:glycosyltransferase involved in cell wall biosynthesis
MATYFNKRWEKQVLHSADLVFTVSDSLKELFGTKTGIDSHKIRVIHNGYDPDDFIKIPGETSDSRLIISYVGTISHSYNISGFLKALQTIPENIKDKILLRFIGRVPAEIRAILHSALPEHQLEIMGYIPHHEAISHMGASSALLLVIPDAENNRGIVTGKLFEYIAVRKPVLLLGPADGDAAQIIRRTERGIICEPSDAADISKALVELFDDSRKEISQYEGNSLAGSFSRKTLAEKVSEALNSLT